MFMKAYGLQAVGPFATPPRTSDFETKARHHPYTTKLVHVY
jgi:hypothetical protein